MPEAAQKKVFLRNITSREQNVRTCKGIQCKINTTTINNTKIFCVSDKSFSTNRLRNIITHFYTNIMKRIQGTKTFWQAGKFSFLRIFFEQTIYRIVLKFVPCFIDINPKYKNYLTKFSDSFSLLPSLSWKNVWR